MSESKDATIALNVRLKSSDSSAHPRAANYTNVGVAQGLDFGFLELALVAKAAKDGQAPQQALWGHIKSIRRPDPMYSRNYVLTGGSWSDQIAADLENDQLFGGGGNDVLDFKGDSAAFTIFRKAA
jgi:hypothetical protein